MRVLLALGLFCFAVPRLVSAGDNLDFKKQLQEEIDQGSATASATFASACINVTRDVRDKRLKIFSVSKAKAGLYKKHGFKVEVIWNEEIADLDPKVSGAYHHHNNEVILTFAAWQFASGRKDLGLWLVRLIAEAQPNKMWSSSKQAPTVIKDILLGLEKNDGTAREFVESGKINWPWYVETYGP